MLTNLTEYVGHLYYKRDICCYTDSCKLIFTSSKYINIGNPIYLIEGFFTNDAKEDNCRF